MLFTASPTVLPLFVSMIEEPFRALLMAFVGLPALLAPGQIAARAATIAVAAIAVRADEEHSVALLAETNPVQKNRVAVFRRHAQLQARLDNGALFVAG